MLCLAGVVLHTFERYIVSLCLASICLLLCPALLVFVHLTWLVAWLSCLQCRIWCKSIIIIIMAFPFVRSTCTFWGWLRACNNCPRKHAKKHNRARDEFPASRTRQVPSCALSEESKMLARATITALRVPNVLDRAPAWHQSTK
jgi:hypothetical protein